MKYIEKFMDKKFGIGGASNYERSQIDTALKCIAYFMSSDLAWVERDTLARFFTEIQENYSKDHKKFNAIDDEAQEIRDGMGWL